MVFIRSASERIPGSVGHGGSSGDLPLRPREMRDRNRALVLGAVARHEPITRAQLAVRTGLTKSSVSAIVTELLGAHLVVEQGTRRGGDLGRPGTELILARDGLAGLGLEVNVDYLAACVVDLARRSRVQFVEVGDNRGRDPAAVAELLARLARAAVAAAATQGLTISATCVAVPGLVDQETGTVARAPNLGWSDVPLRRLLAGGVPAARTPVLVENEANMAALGELWFGDGAALGDYVHISGEIGVGAGIVVGGQLFRGAHGHAGELGHTTLEPDGAACTCGRPGLPRAVRRPGGDPAPGRPRPGRVDQHRAVRRPGQRPGRPPGGRGRAGHGRPGGGRPQPRPGHGLAGQAGRPGHGGAGRDLRRARPLAVGVVPGRPAGGHPHDQGGAAPDRQSRAWPGRGRPRRRRAGHGGLLAHPGALLSDPARA
jgi:DNA-binding transcriptional ArsR family regulator